MKASIIKKLMMGALAVSLVMAPAMGTFAATTVVGGSCSTGETKKTVVEKKISDDTQGEVTAVAEIPTTSTVAGTKSSLNGVYLATNVNGSAVSTGIAAIKEGYGLKSNEQPYAKFYNLDAKKSPLAMKSIELAAASQGAVVGPALNVDLGKMTSGKFELLPSDGAEIRLSFGIPKSFAEEGKTFAVVCVRAGGVVTILEDIDDDPDTVTFDTKGGAGVYAIIKY